MKVGIAIDEWKLSIFERHLQQSGYAFENAGSLTEGMLILRVDTENPDALGVVVKAANTECFLTGAPQ